MRYEHGEPLRDFAGLLVAPQLRAANDATYPGLRAEQHAEPVLESNFEAALAVREDALHDHRQQRPDALAGLRVTALHGGVDEFAHRLAGVVTLAVARGLYLGLEPVALGLLTVELLRVRVPRLRGRGVARGELLRVVEALLLKVDLDLHGGELLALGRQLGVRRCPERHRRRRQHHRLQEPRLPIPEPVAVPPLARLPAGRPGPGLGGRAARQHAPPIPAACRAARGAVRPRGS